MSKRIIIATMGTRGDLQPYVALALGLERRGWDVALSGPAEYRCFGESFGLHYLDAGTSLQRAMRETPEGLALRSCSLLTSAQCAKRFFSPALLASWLDNLAQHCLDLRPHVLLLTSFITICGAAVLPQLLGLPDMKVLVGHPIPMSPTSHYAMPLAGTGLSAPLPVLNLMQWRVAEWMAPYLDSAQRCVDSAAARLQAEGRLAPGGPRRFVLGPSLGTADIHTLYLYSPTLLPKPRDYSSKLHVVGPLMLPPAADEPPSPPPPSTPACRLPEQPLPSKAPAVAAACGGQPAGGGKEECFVIGVAAYAGGDSAAASPSTPATPPPAPEQSALPPDLQAFLDKAARDSAPVVYIGLGSMLGTVFERGQAQEVLACLVKAALLLAARSRARAVIHTLGLPSAGGALKPDAAALPPPSKDVFLLHSAVSHRALLPQVALAVHHGGAGTTHATVAAGKPAVVVPCVPASDQPFWADLVGRRGLGPAPWFPVARLTAPRLCGAMLCVLQRLDEFTANCEAAAARMQREDGVEHAAAIIEAVAATAGQVR